MLGKSILLVDDDPLILDTARRLLEHADFNVVVYTEGFNATNFAARALPDLVLMDVNMPFLSGDNLIGLFKRHPVLKDVPIVLFSSNEESQLRSMAASVGAIGFISKSEMAHGFANQVRRFLFHPRRSSRPPAY
jgi:CheY-like chemotaxis protein